MPGFRAKNATVTVTIPSTQQVVSLRSAFGWLTIYTRLNFNFPLNQPAAVYVDGFGNITSNLWLGLERIHLLTNPMTNGGVQYRLRFELLDENLRSA